MWKSCEEILLPLIPQCLSASYALLGTHPFSRLDVLIVPSNFSSLGMASPHIIFLSQSTLSGGSHLCGTRLCHEIAHSWFGLAIGARDWTEEWLSEGFATHLEDAFWSAAQQLLADEARERQDLKALLRWQRLRDEVQNSEEDLQVLRPNKENTGKVTESGASVVKHGLNAEKTFMQVHYLKGYFLLRFLAGKAGEAEYFAFLRKFVWRFHGQLILSQVLVPISYFLSSDQLVLLLECLLEKKTLCSKTLECLQKTYHLREQDAEVRHRWCELVIKHKYVAGYVDVEKFLKEDQVSIYLLKFSTYPQHFRMRFLHLFHYYIPEPRAFLSLSRFFSSLKQFLQFVLSSNYCHGILTSLH
uniref:Peptidase M1 leukotriene A4 hydrolase/aminopeptidase C-terminal domain-containing protein n=1 Tax=Anolis carolinensis TaxID=28377 RepID=A0A803SNG4_ANOCA